MWCGRRRGREFPRISVDLKSSKGVLFFKMSDFSGFFWIFWHFGFSSSEPRFPAESMPPAIIAITTSLRLTVHRAMSADEVESSDAAKSSDESEAEVSDQSSESDEESDDPSSSEEDDFGTHDSQQHRRIEYHQNSSFQCT